MPGPRLSLFGSTVSLLGAFTVGWALHAVWQDGIAAWSPAPVTGGLIGGILLVGGYRWQRRFEPSRLVAGREDDEHEYDPSLSPIDDPDRGDDGDN